MDTTKYLIIGNGIAGLSAAQEIRKNDPEGRIVLVTKEPHHTYYRLKLTELIAKPLTDKELFLLDEATAEEKKLEVWREAAVQSVDLEKKKAVLEDGKEIEYESLLFATGSQPFVPKTPGQDKKNVVSIRTLDDVRTLQDRFADVDTVVVIGGGLLGLEAAWSLKALGKQVHVVELAPYLLPRQLDEPSSAKLMDTLTKEGFTLHTDNGVQEVLGDEDVTGVRLNSGETVACGGVLFNIGVVPDTALAKEAGLEVERGIVVDEHMRTGKPDVYAAGDCIQFGGMAFGLWTASNTQGRVAGANMAGQDKTYEKPKLFTNLKLGSVQLFSSGDVQKSDEVREFQKTPDTFQKFFFREGKPVGGILYGDIRAMGKVNQLIDGDLSFEAYKEAVLDA